MGKTKKEKQVMLEELKQTLSEAELVVAIDYKGLSVAEITNLRRRLLEKGSSCTVAKNTIMGRAIKDDSTWEPMQELLKGPNAFLFLKDDLGAGIKAYQEFQKATKKTEFKGGVMEGRLLDEASVKAIADLPSKEELMGQVAGAINNVATKLAVGLNAVPTKVAVGIKEVPASLNRAIAAIAAKEEGDAA
jgi:large subunit ribosomal protein L10